MPGRSVYDPVVFRTAIAPKAQAIVAVVLSLSIEIKFLETEEAGTASCEEAEVPVPAVYGIIEPAWSAQAGPIKRPNKIAEITFRIYKFHSAQTNEQKAAVIAATVERK